MGFAALAVAVGTSLLESDQKARAGQIAKDEAKIVASQEELGAVQREADRKGRLAKAMASQNAAAGAGNIAAFEGSPLSILEADIRAEETATERDVFSSELAALTTRARGAQQKSSMNQQANLGLLKDFTKIAQAA